MTRIEHCNSNNNRNRPPFAHSSWPKLFWVWVSVSRQLLEEHLLEYMRLAIIQAQECALSRLSLFWYCLRLELRRVLPKSEQHFSLESIFSLSVTRTKTWIERAKRPDNCWASILHLVGQIWSSEPLMSSLTGCLTAILPERKPSSSRHVINVMGANHEKTRARANSTNIIHHIYRRPKVQTRASKIGSQPVRLTLSPISWPNRMATCARVSSQQQCSALRNMPDGNAQLSICFVTPILLYPISSYYYHYLARR